MNTTTTVEDEWVRRIGPEAVRLRRARARLRGWACVLAPAGVVIVFVAIAIAMSWGMTQNAQSVLALGLTIGFVDLFASLLCALKARQLFFALRGAALGFTKRWSPAATDSGLNRALRDSAAFDSWLERWSHRSQTAASATGHWGPDETRVILPGRTARDWFCLAVIASIGFAATVVIGTVPLAVMAFHHVWSGVAVVGAVAGVFLSTACVTAILGRRKLGAEYAHGYATNMPGGGYRGVNDFRTDLDLVDGKTGRLLRRAGDPPLDRDAYLNRIREVRAAQPNAIALHGTRRGRRSR